MVTFNERADDLSPGVGGFDMKGGKATLILDVAPDELEDAITELLGSVSPAGDGTLTRTLPKAHPFWPWLFASRISNIQGVRFNEAVEANDELEAPSLDEYGEYELWRLTVEFEPRPYAVLADDSIELESVNWYDEAGGGGPVDLSTEYYRFTDYDVLPQPELITANQGQMSLVIGVSTTAVFQSFPRITMPKAVVKFRWYQIPFSYVDSTNSYLTDYIGYINQNAWYGWPAGSLLYTGATVVRYTPPVPDVVPGFAGVSFSTEKLCDVELVFEYTKREAEYTPTLSNPNWIVGGHNLQPRFTDRKFYYVKSNADGQSLFPSVPFDLLFHDPDVSL